MTHALDIGRIMANAADAVNDVAETLSDSADAFTDSGWLQDEINRLDFIHAKILADMPLSADDIKRIVSALTSAENKCRDNGADSNADDYETARVYFEGING